MTAVNAFVQPGAAYLSSDAAIWGADGRLQAVEQKIIALDHLKTAIVASGVLSRGLLEAAAARAPSLDGLHQIVATFIATNVERVRQDKRWAGVSADALTIRVTGASWWGKRPVIWAIDPAHGDLGAYDMGAARWSPDVDTGAVLGRPIGSREDVDALDVHAASLALMEAQRRQTYDLGFGPFHAAGGRCELAKVTRRGVSVVTLAEWPDIVGERIAA